MLNVPRVETSSLSHRGREHAGVPGRRGPFGIHVLEALPAEDSTMMALVRLTGVGIVISDLWYRRDQQIPFFSLEASTFFFVIPTWAVGVFFLLVSQQFLVG